MSDSIHTQAALLVDFVAALGSGTREELEQACPFPVLIDVSASPDEGPSLGGRRPDEADVSARLRAALATADVVHLLEPADGEGGYELVAPGVEGLRFMARGDAWSVEDEGAAGGLVVEGRPRGPGVRQPVSHGQRIEVGGRRLLFLLPAALRAIVDLASAGATVVLPAHGLMLKDLHAITRAARPRETCWPSLLVQVPTDDVGIAPGDAAMTQELTRSAVLGLERDLRDDGLVHALSGHGPVTIGRADDCELLLVDGSVSKRHAQLVRRDGAWHIVDLGSQNGTFVRGEQALPGVLTRLQDGDAVWFAKHRCVFLSPEGAQRMLRFLDART